MTQRRNILVRMLAALAALVLCLGGVIVISGADEDEQMEIVSSYPYTTVTRVKVNLRAGRSVRSTLLKKIPAGAEISVLSKKGDWAEVDYGKYTGYVKTEFIVLKEVKKLKVTPTPTPIPTLSPAEDAGGYIILKRGSSGSEVRALQEALIELGYLKGSADGEFGAATENAVIAFQQKNSYPDTGLVDANLQAYLYAGKPISAAGVATKINTLSPAEGAVMRLNNTGEKVGTLQTKLAELGYYTGEINRKYDEATRKAVTAFQKKNGLKADGVAGGETQNVLFGSGALAANATATPTPTPTPSPTPNWVIPKTTVKNGSEGEDARTVQTRLKDLGYYRGKVDGIFGRASVNALKNFQERNNLEADGVGGTETYKILFSTVAIPFSTATPTAEAIATPGAVQTETSTTASAAAASAATVSVWKTLRVNDTGDAVSQLQEALIQLGYLAGKPDGTYGQKTVAAVKDFQTANGLTADGTAGEKTLKALFSGTAKAAKVKATTQPASAAEAATTISSVLKKGSEGNDVKTLQRKLIELGYLKGEADGIYGSKTVSAVKAFQKASKLTADGVAGSATLGALNSSKSSTTATVTAAPATQKPAGTTSTVVGKPSASQVIYANWYTTVKSVCRQYPYATVYDFSTGISWQIHIFSVGAHADYEPLTANDTARMQRAFGGQTTWNPKAVWVIFADGSVYIGSTHDTPHDTWHIKDNNFDGHSCLHFPRTQEQVTNIGPYATSHQETIDKGWASTQAMK